MTGPGGPAPSDRPPTLIVGSSARRRVVGWTAWGFAVIVSGLAWVIAGAFSGGGGLLWMILTLAALLAVFGWQGVLVVQAAHREYKAGYTTINLRLDRYWLLDDRTGEPISAPRGNSLPDTTSNAADP